MKRIILALTFLLVTSSLASAQFTPTKENLRGLPAVRLIVMFHGATRAEAFDDVQRPGLLKMLEDDSKVKLQDAGIPFSRSNYADDIGNARLIVLVTLDQLNGFKTEVKLVQRVHLVRDPSIEFDAVTWSSSGTGNKAETPIIQSQVASLINNFIRDYLSENPKQSASSSKDAKR